VLIRGRQYPVQILYTVKPEQDIIEAAFLTCLQVNIRLSSLVSLVLRQVHEEEEDGGILIFLPGQEDIESVHQLLEEHLPSITPQAMPPLPPPSSSAIPSPALEQDPFEPSPLPKEGSALSYRIYPLYAALSSEEQLFAFQPSVPGIRKIILATNIAETSVTISGIKYVIDPGKVKTRCMHPFTGADMLQVLSLSRAVSLS
jgi:ATP-dependent RNA helicase DHX8/PRP22